MEGGWSGLSHDLLESTMAHQILFGCTCCWKDLTLQEEGWLLKELKGWISPALEAWLRVAEGRLSRDLAVTPHNIL